MPASKTLALREDFIAIAALDVGKTEVSRNQSPTIRKFWPATSYGIEAFKNREPYCAAAMCYWLQQWLRNPGVCSAIGVIDAEKWRCKSASAFGWIDWARSQKLMVMDDSPKHVLHTADIMVFDMSHIGIVTGDEGSKVFTIEANTGSAGGRDGEGIFRKTRERSLARAFIRILE